MCGFLLADNMGDAWYTGLTAQTKSIDNQQFEESIKSLPPEVQEKLRAAVQPAASAAWPVAPEPTEEERKAEILKRSLDGLKHGNLITMMKEIKAGNVQMEQLDEAGNPLLHVAVWREDMAVAKEMLALCPVDLKNSKGQTALHLAAARSVSIQPLAHNCSESTPSRLPVSRSAGRQLRLSGYQWQFTGSLGCVC